MVGDKDATAEQKLELDVCPYVVFFVAFPGLVRIPSPDPSASHERWRLVQACHCPMPALSEVYHRSLTVPFLLLAGTRDVIAFQVKH